MKTEELVVGVDVGHSVRHPGATSARGKPEHIFNYRMALSLLDVSRRHHGIELQVLEKAHEDLDVHARMQRAMIAECSLIVSLHHNSVPECHLESWTWRGKRLRRSRVSSGFSLFVSGRNAHFQTCLAYARSIGSELVLHGFTPDTSDEPFQNEARHLIDEKIGLNQFNTLAILNVAQCPAVLIECGVIINDLDEPILASAKFQQNFAESTIAGICHARNMSEAE